MTIAAEQQIALRVTREAQGRVPGDGVELAWMEAFFHYEVDDEGPGVKPKASEAAVRTDVAEAFKKDEITQRLRSLRVPVMLLRAEEGLTPGQPPIFPDSIMEPFRECVRGMQEEVITGTTHYTITLGERGASRVADLISEFAERCQPAQRT